MNEAARTPKEIWEDDKFDRIDEARMLIAYIESVWDRPIVREDGRGFTIAVDAGYGVGKSYFLRRLKEHLALNHPVAFVDAWTDDILDDPLTALAATLKRALAPLIDANPKVEARWKSVMEKTGRVAWLAGKGLLRRAATAAFTAGALTEMDDLFDGESEAIKEAAGDTGKELAKDLVNAPDQIGRITSPSTHLAKRIADFEDGAEAIQELKASLGALVEELTALGKSPPIVIIIDELDRCRPTYSVKLLEEIKHLFDVPGLVFVFGMNSDQLGNSMSAAYGSKFDGRSYLQRFINRRYSLKFPDLTNLLSALLGSSHISEERFTKIEVKQRNDIYVGFSLPGSLARYMHLYNLTARDAFRVVDLLQTTIALAGDGVLFTPYLLPLLMSHLQGGAPGEIIPPANNADWQIVVRKKDYNRAETLEDPIRWASLLYQRIITPHQELYQRSSNDDMAATFVMDHLHRVNGKSDWLRPTEYPELLQMVGRFTTKRTE